MKFRDEDARQATKRDLFDIAQALGCKPLMEGIPVGALREQIRVRIELLARLGRLDTEFDRFATWAEVIAHCSAGLPLYYHAPLDPRPYFVDYRRRTGRTLRIIPGVGADPFVADAGHLSRMRRTRPEET